MSGSFVYTVGGTSHLLPLEGVQYILHLFYFMKVSLLYTPRALKHLIYGNWIGQSDGQWLSEPVHTELRCQRGGTYFIYLGILTYSPQKCIAKNHVSWIAFKKDIFNMAHNGIRQTLNQT